MSFQFRHRGLAGVQVLFVLLDAVDKFVHGLIAQSIRGTHCFLVAFLAVGAKRELVDVGGVDASPAGGGRVLFRGRRTNGVSVWAGGAQAL